jgi:hypothetical protein
MTMFSPSFRGEMTERTTIRIAHDGEFLYAAARFSDSDRAGIRANSMVRDVYADDDAFNVVIDSFNDEESSLWFLVTPLGTRIDGAITNDAEGANWNNYDYNSFWDAAARIHDAGWNAEMRIPLSSLRFRNVDGTVTMGFIAGRNIVRKQERHTFPAIEQGPAQAQFKPSLSAKVQLKGVRPRTPLFIAPFLLVGGRHLERQDASRQDAATRDAGVDLKVGLSNQLTLDLTMNTDFAQTEVDDQQVNLTRFSLFYPEKRQFFQERAGTFDFDAGSESRLFHSRTIGLSPTGAPVRLVGGARLAGQLGEWDAGLLTMRSTPHDSAPGVTDLVLRARRPVLNANSFVGVMHTGRIGDGASRSASGVDGVFRLLGENYLTLGGAASHATGSGLDGDDAILRTSWERRNLRGMGYRAAWTRVGESYTPPLGFVARTGISVMETALSHGSFGGTGRVQDRRISAGATVVRRLGDDLVESSDLEGSLELTRRGGGRLAMAMRWRTEDLLAPFPLGDEAVIGAGEYGFAEGEISLDLPPGFRGRGSAFVSGGRYFDGHRLSAGISPKLSVSPRLELSGAAELNRVWFPDRGESFRGDLVRVRARLSADPRLSANLLLQWNWADGSAIANTRIRYNFAEGHDVHLVITTGRADALTGPATGSELRASRSLLLKYQRTFQ